MKINKLLPALLMFLGIVAGVIATAPANTPDVSTSSSEANKGKFQGNIIPLAEFVKKHGSDLDPEAAPHWLGLQTKDGKIYSIIRDTGGQTFYKDERLWRRPMQIRGRVLPGSHLLQVLSVTSLKDDKPHVVYYWCEVCAIKRFAFDKQCECCGGPMEFREEEVGNRQ